ncbi:Zinc finger BED domain-containing protein 4 [Bienertia sinuspersici]
MAGNLEDPIIPESGGEDEIESVDATDKGKKSSNVKVLQSGKKRQRRLSSSVWTNYDFLDEPDKDGNLVCKCKRCGITYNANSKNGTGNLIRHIDLLALFWLLLAHRQPALLFQFGFNLVFIFLIGNMNPQLEALCGTIMKLNVEEEKDDTPIPSSEDVASPHQSSSTMLA